MRRGLGIRHWGLTVAVLALLSSGSNAQTSPTLDEVLRQLHAYLTDYADRLPATIASEHYQQRVGSGVRYQLRSWNPNTASSACRERPTGSGFVRS